jgi:hypothetical protein
VISAVDSLHARCDHLIEIIRGPSEVKLARSLMMVRTMRTIQISIGEIIEAVYAELVENYGDKELALLAAQAVGDDLLSRLASATAAECDCS